MSRSALARDVELPEDEKSLAAAAESVEAVVVAFKEAGKDEGLGKLLFYMLPKREAVWAACLVARAAEKFYGAVPSRACAAAELWVRDQSEEARYKAFELADAEGFDRPGAWAALSAFWAGPSMAPADAEQAVAPAPYHFVVAAVNAFTLALPVNPDLYPHGLKLYLGVIEDIARGETGMARLTKAIEVN
ncbi:MAG: hypothetical protein AAF668_07400 [Pseudomonadota bacterium]